MKKTKPHPPKPEASRPRRATNRELIAYAVAVVSLWFSLEYAIAGYRAHEEARLMRDYADRKLAEAYEVAARPPRLGPVGSWEIAK